MAANTWYPVQVTGQAGVPASGVSAVQVSVTVLTPAATGLVKVAANGTAVVPIAALTYTGGGGSISASSITALAADGKIRVLAQTSVTLLVHVQGYYTAGNGFPAPGGYVPVAPARVVDTRTGVGLPQAKLATGSTTAISVGDLANVPADASAVFVMLTAISTGATAGYFSPYPTGTTRPANVSLNYLANTATVLGAAVDLGTGGQFNLWVGPAGVAIDMIIDVVGYYTATPGTGGAFTPAVARVYDSRISPNTAVAANSSRVVQVGGVAGLSAADSGVTAYAVSAQVVHSGSGSGSLALGPGDQASAAVAALYFSAGSNVRSGLVMVPPDEDGRVLLVNSSPDSVNVILDVEGWYTSGPGLPVIESAAYPELGWVPPGGSSASFTIVDSGTSAAASHFRYSLDEEPAITIPSATAEITLTPPTALGAHTLSVTAIDRLGLTSPTNVHKFYIGSPPAAPAGLAIRAGDGSAELTWSAGQDNGAPTHGFRFWVIDRTTGAAPLGLGSCRECTRFVLTGLDPAHTYAAQVAASSAAGSSILSTSQDFGAVGDPITCSADDLACESQDIGQPANLDPLYANYDLSGTDDDASGGRSGLLTDPTTSVDPQCAVPLKDRVGAWVCSSDAATDDEAPPAQLTGYCSYKNSCWSRRDDFHASWKGEAGYGYGWTKLGTTSASVAGELAGARSNSWPIAWRATGPTEDVMLSAAMFNGAPGVPRGGSYIRDSLDLTNNTAIVAPNRSIYWSYSFSNNSMYDHNVITTISWEVPGYRGFWYQYVRSLVSHIKQLGRSAIYRFAPLVSGLPGDKDGAGYRR